MDKNTDMIAACGLNCGECSLRRIEFDKAAAKKVIKWFKQEGWLKDNEGLKEVLARKMYC